MTDLPDMPAVRFTTTNGIRMAYYEAGPAEDPIPIVLCHGWPELAYSWRHQIKGLAAAGYRVIAPDQRGYGLSDRPDPVEAYDMEHLTGDLVGLLDALAIRKAIFVGHDWGGFVVWNMGLRHPDRVAGVIGVNTPHFPRAPMDPIELFRRRYGERMYIVQFQNPDRAPDRIFADNVETTFSFFMRKPIKRAQAADGENASEAGIGASSTVSLDFPRMVKAYHPSFDRREPILTDAEMAVFVSTFKRTGFTGGINWYRNFSRNWQRSADLDHTVRVPSLMIMAEHDLVLPPSAADGMERIVPDLTRHLVRDCGHWTQQEKPAEVTDTIIRWRKARFG
jgi:pimeloyl-ACP methyl ester carboxylesterase